MNKMSLGSLEGLRRPPTPRCKLPQGKESTHEDVYLCENGHKTKAQGGDIYETFKYWVGIF